MALKKKNTNFRFWFGTFRPKKTGLPLFLRCSQTFLTGRTQKVMFHLPFTRISQKRIVYALANNCNATEKLSAMVMHNFGGQTR